MKPRVVQSSPDGPKKPVHLAALETKLFGHLLNVLKHCAINRYDDGTPRTPGCIILRCDGSNWKLILKEPDGALQLSVVASTFDDVWCLADLLLGAEEAPWEPDRNAQNGKTKKR